MAAKDPCSGGGRFGGDPGSRRPRRQDAGHGSRRHGEQRPAGVKMVESLHPDVVTLDIQMPVMDGLETLDAISRAAGAGDHGQLADQARGRDHAGGPGPRGAWTICPSPNGAEIGGTFQEELSRKIRSRPGPTCGGSSKSAASGKPRQLQLAGRATRRHGRRRADCRAELAGVHRDRHFHGRAAGAGQLVRARWSRRCRRSSWCSTCRPISPSRWPGG